MALAACLSASTCSPYWGPCPEGCTSTLKGTQASTLVKGGSSWMGAEVPSEGLLDCWARTGAASSSSAARASRGRVMVGKP